MSNLTFLIPFRGEGGLRAYDQTVGNNDLILFARDSSTAPPGATVIEGQFFKASSTLNRILQLCKSRYLAVVDSNYPLEIRPTALNRLIAELQGSGAPFAYSDFEESSPSSKDALIPHPLCVYTEGSVRDNFDFGALQLYDLDRIKEAINKFGPLSNTNHAAWYELHLIVSLIGLPKHVPEPLYIARKGTAPADHDAHFAYVNPANRDVQVEMEQVFTRYSKLAGFYLPQRTEFPDQALDHPIEASVIIPVKNRVKTIPDAVKSALSQTTKSSFNVLVVDNHSSDGTTEELRKMSALDPRLVHIIPERNDLLIGGCWERAIQDERCGKHAIQLDSDDLYIDTHTIDRILHCFREERCAAVVGSYNLVNFDLQPIPPGLIDHREWSDANGHNNALRINGLGAPRAFCTPVLRSIGFPNKSYGEDYAVMLAITRRYRLGRIYDPLYLCRRWDGNTEANISIEKDNANNMYKDSLRAAEINARKKLAAE